jgi:hypothetical protein
MERVKRSCALPGGGLFLCAASGGAEVTGMRGQVPQWNGTDILGAVSFACVADISRILG